MSTEQTYRAVKAGVGTIDRSDRVRLEVTGPDRAKFLHNLTTNEVKRLGPGQGCEAFVTSLQGKTLGFVTLLVLEECVLVRADPASLDGLLAHFRKYGALDDVAWTDVSEQTFELHFTGPRLPELTSAMGIATPGEADLCHGVFDLSGQQVRAVREGPAGLPGLTLIGRVAALGAVQEAIRAAGPIGLTTIDSATFEALRIEAGTPVFGRDITPENLPQEVGRDARAINFVKGCYLGQETVARIDALGHVNKILKGGQVEEENVPPPQPGTALEMSGKPAGTITSSALSPGRGRPVVLAMVRLAHAQSGTTLEFENTSGRHSLIVTDLPMPEPE
ncbi:MAG TPA: glycine cleavage T C-terminal barrel domain-containing protein [Isosphaeraceae bacterium]|jgi:hypothetical protein|nr:glycine cleavage T C-terminal barrel domain-containing protein [Isosphaeraceae bacterium]